MKYIGEHITSLQRSMLSPFDDYTNSVVAVFKQLSDVYAIQK